MVFTPGDTEVYVDTGERQHSGTGRNRVTTQIVKIFDIMAAIPFKLNRRPATGVEIEATSDIIAPLLRQTRGSWVYRSVLEPHETLKALLRVKGTKKMVGGMVTVRGGRGRLILVPELVLQFDEDVDQDEDEEFGQQAQDESVPAETDGEPASAGETETAPDLATLDDDQGGAAPSSDPDEAWPADLLLRWVESLMIEPDASLPGWTESYRFATEVERLALQLEVEEEVAVLQKRLDQFEAAQIQDEKWKTLIAASGASLEVRVREAFELFGFQFSEVDPGRSDLRGSYDGQLVVVEVKGVGKSAAEKHAAQLEKWVSEELAEGRTAKGVLVVNTWRDRPLRERDPIDFPEQMLAYSAQRGHCLVTGLQILAMVRACLSDPGRANQVAELLLNTVGPVDNWGDLDSIFPSKQDNLASVTQVEVEGPKLETPEAEIDLKPPSG